MRLSLQLYTVRDAMAADLDGTLAAVRGSGLEYVELAGTYGRSASEFASILVGHGLKVSGSHTGIEGLEQNFGQVVADTKAFDNTWVIVPYIGQDRRNWSELAKTFNNLARQLAAEGLKFAYHNHDFEFAADQGLRTLVAETDPALVYFQVDLGWVRFAGDDPAQFIQEIGSRAPLVHLKDMAPDRENPHVVAGDGQVNWSEVIAACQSTGVQFGSIEMDLPPTDPVEDTKACVRYFQGLGLR